MKSFMSPYQKFPMKRTHSQKNTKISRNRKLNSPVFKNKVEFIIQNLPTKKVAGKDCLASLVNSIKHPKKKLC